MIVPRVSYPAAVLAAALVFSACSGAGSGVANPQSGADAGTMPGVQTAVSDRAQVAQAGGSLVTQAPPAPALPLALKAGPDLSAPIINDTGSYVNGPIILGNNTAAGGIGVQGIAQSTGGYGVFGEAIGTGYIGVYGKATTPGGYGFYGYSSQGDGMRAYSNSVNYYGGYFSNGAATGTALDAVATGGAAVLANSGTGIAMQASTGGVNAIDGYSNGDSYGAIYTYNSASSGFGGFLQGGNGLAVQDLTSGGYSILAENSSGSQVFYIDDSGNAYFAGNLHTSIAGRGGHVLGYAPTAASPTTEDTGSAHLVNGVATVRLDPTFASTIDASRPYQVMLTPDGDTRGLFVESKTANGFTVREVQGGRSSIGFDYHVYAPVQGHANERATITNGLQGPHRAIAPAHRVN